MSSKIQIQGATKRYGDTVALDGVSLTLEQGRIYGLLGRNGAGKTTLLNLITGRAFADEGGITLDGAPLPENDAALRQIYMLSEKVMYPESMRVKAAFRWSGTFYPGFDAALADRLAADFGLNPRKKVSALSTGYKTIFKICVALATGAAFILLDEPVRGLDANHRELFYKLALERFAQTGCCLVLSTHLVEEVSGLIEDVVIIHEGKLLRHESRDALLAGGYAVSGPAGAVDAFVAGRQVLSVEGLGGLKTANILGQRPAETPAGLELAALDLQKLFVQLTNQEGGH